MLDIWGELFGSMTLEAKVNFVRARFSSLCFDIFVHSAEIVRAASIKIEFTYTERLLNRFMSFAN